MVNFENKYNKSFVKSHALFEIFCLESFAFIGKIRFIRLVSKYNSMRKLKTKSFSERFKCLNFNNQL